MSKQMGFSETKTPQEAKSSAAIYSGDLAHLYQLVERFDPESFFSIIL